MRCVSPHLSENKPGSQALTFRNDPRKAALHVELAVAAEHHHCAAPVSTVRIAQLLHHLGGNLDVGIVRAPRQQHVLGTGDNGFISSEQQQAR